MNHRPGVRDMVSCRISGSFVIALVTAGCRDGAELRGATPMPDGASFVSDVYPILLRDCAFYSNCHGASERFLQVFGPGRTRLDSDTGQDDPIVLSEVTYSYDRARSMLGTDADPASSLLLRKPLEVAGGGQTHHGADAFGRNVFTSKKSPNYDVLLQWALTYGEPPQQDDIDAANAAASAAIEAWLGSQ